jgi:hypothetical protein
MAEALIRQNDLARNVNGEILNISEIAGINA